MIMKKIPRGMSPQGFMLLEVMISLSILSLGMVIVIQSYAGSLRAIRRSRDITRVVFLAEQKLEELRRESYSAEELEGNFGEEYPGLEWRIDSAPLEIDEEEIENLNKVTLTLLRGERQMVKIATYLPTPDENVTGTENERE